MNAASIFNLARDLTHTNDVDYPNSKLLPYLNAVKDDFWSYIITAVKANYNWDIWQIESTVSGQSEYVIPHAATDSEWNLKINWISVAYEWERHADGSLKYVSAREVNPNWLPKHWNHYINNQPENDPIYFTADKSLFIAPAFKKSINHWIELTWIKSIEDYTESATEQQIKIPSYLHNDLVQWLMYYIIQSEWKKTSAINQWAIYRERRDAAVKKITNRSIWPSYIKYDTDPYGYYDEHDDWIH